MHGATLPRLLVAVLVALLAAGGSAGSGARPRSPFLLVSLASLGTVTWSCSGRQHRYSLAFRPFASSATADVRLILAKRVVRRATVHPGQSLRLPPAGLSQRLELRQATGAGTVKAWIGVRFDRRPVVSHCFAYSPPHTSVRITTRR